MSHVRDRFDSRGYLVRLIFGEKPQVFPIPGVVDSRIWRIEHTVSRSKISRWSMHWRWQIKFHI